MLPFLFLSTIHIVLGQEKLMIITYGKPTNYSNYLNYQEADDWRDCVTHCYNLDSCVLAYSPISPLQCQIFAVNQIFEVKKLDSSDKQLVAFKVINNSTSGTCPAGDNPPTFGNSPNYGFASTEISNYRYQIDYHSDKTWRLQYKTKLVCTAGWTTFVRPKTTWCIKVFGYPNTSYTQAQAESVCQAENATLSGLESVEERDFASGTALSLLGADYPEYAGMWISGVRKPKCAVQNYASDTDCTSTIKQFTYSDTYLSTYAGYTWDPNQPDRKSNSGVWQNCVIIWLRLKATNNGNGNSDDASCQQSGAPMFSMRGGVCGKLPEVLVGA